MTSHRRAFQEGLATPAIETEMSESPLHRSADPFKREEDLDDSSFAVLAEAPLGRAYNEKAFRYFLEIERKRSEISNRPFLLLLVDLKKVGDSDRDLVVNPAIVEKLFAALATCLRDTDLIGWYRESRIVGAVLTQHTETGGNGICELIGQRVNSALHHGLSTATASRLQVRVYQLPANTLRPSHP